MENIYLYKIARLFFAIIAKTLFRFVSYGKENIPKKSGILIATNHKSYLDPVIIGIGAKRPVRYLARKTLFGNPIFGRLILSVGAIPIQRDGFSREGMGNAISIIKSGQALALFPEGTRNASDEFLEGKPGVGMVALKSMAIVVPGFIKGSDKILPRGAKFLRRGQISIRFGPPVNVDDLRQGEYTKEKYIEAVRRIMEGIGKIREEEKIIDKKRISSRDMEKTEQ